MNAIFPRQFDNRFEGQRAALWLLGFLLAVKLAMGVNSILNTASVATGADGIPLESFGPEASRAVLMFFSLWALGQLALAAVGVTALMRYRAMVPFVYALLLSEQVARRVIVQSYAVERTEAASAAVYVNLGLLFLLAAGLALSLWPRRPGANDPRHGGKST